MWEGLAFDSKEGQHLLHMLKAHPGFECSPQRRAMFAISRSACCSPGVKGCSLSKDSALILLEIQIPSVLGFGEYTRLQLYSSGDFSL